MCVQYENADQFLRDNHNQKLSSIMIESNRLQPDLLKQLDNNPLVNNIVFSSANDDEYINSILDD